jgi:hypothetical protein
MVFPKALAVQRRRGSLQRMPGFARRRKASALTQVGRHMDHVVPVPNRDRWENERVP